MFFAQSELLIWVSLFHRYLDSVINLAYTLLRMLEKYSKSKAYMYVRKKRAGRAANARKKKKRESRSALHRIEYVAESSARPIETDTADENAEEGLGMGEDEEELEVERGTVSFGEHAFQFEKFEQVSPPHGGWL